MGKKHHGENRKNKQCKKNYNIVKRWEKNKEKRINKALKREERMEKRRNIRLKAFEEGKFGNFNKIGSYREQLLKAHKLKLPASRFPEKSKDVKELEKVKKYQDRKKFREHRDARNQKKNEKVQS